jgi:hypothetical protein
VAAYIATNSTVMVCLIFDEDDPCLDEYMQIKKPMDWVEMVMPKNDDAGIMDLENHVMQYAPAQPYYGMLGDDSVPETVEWDQRLIEAAGSDGVAWPNDGIQGGKFGTMLVLGGDLVREMGWIAPPGLKHLYVDNLWTAIGRARGKATYLPEVIVRHHHFSNGLAIYDETYRRHSKFAANDQVIYAATIKQLRIPMA